MIKVIIIDDHPIVLEGLKRLLSGKPDIVLAGSYENGLSGLEAIKTIQPDVLLLDINLPDINGITLCKQIRGKYKDLKIIALSVHNERPVIKSMLQNGVNGYVLKNSVGNEIIQAIHAAQQGEVYLCSKTQEALKNGGSENLLEVPRITRREKEILQLIGQGLTSVQIAEQLFISTHTVESHRKNLMEKFDVNSTTAVIRLATEYGLL